MPASTRSVPSREPSSSTTTSKSGYSCASSDRTHGPMVCSSSRAGTSTDTRGSGPVWRKPRSRRIRMALETEMTDCTPTKTSSLCESVRKEMTFIGHPAPAGAAS